jgi:hypothetical protein
MQCEASEDPIWKHVLVIERNRGAVCSAYKATVAVRNVRDKPLEAELDYPAISVQHRTIGSDMKHDVIVERSIYGSSGCGSLLRVSSILVHFHQRHCPRWRSL